MIKIEHTVVALPFAFLGALLAVHGLPRLSQIPWIPMAMVGTRSGAMAFNSLAGIGIVAVLLAYKHSLVRPSDLSKVNTAFFTINGWISILLPVTTSLDYFWKKTP
jgi:4-hydroxybenzoate polyprenyltransferase